MIARFIKKYFEWFLLAQILLALYMLYISHPIGGILKLVGILLIAGFYLVSGIRVLLDSRVERVMRILYFLGLWALSVGWIGTLYKISFWEGAESLLFLGMSGAVVVILISIWVKNSKDEALNLNQLNPLLYRAVPHLLLFIAVYLLTPLNTYQWFGEFKDNQEYTDLFMEYWEDREDESKKLKWEEYHKKLQENGD